jgi:hypothetical protein
MPDTDADTETGHERHSALRRFRGQADRQGVFETGSSSKAMGITPNSNLQLERYREKETDREGERERERKRERVSDGG